MVTKIGFWWCFGRIWSSWFLLGFARFVELQSCFSLVIVLMFSSYIWRIIWLCLGYIRMCCFIQRCVILSWVTVMVLKWLLKLRVCFPLFLWFARVLLLTFFLYLTASGFEARPLCWVTTLFSCSYCSYFVVFTIACLWLCVGIIPIALLLVPGWASSFFVCFTRAAVFFRFLWWPACVCCFPYFLFVILPLPLFLLRLCIL